MTTNPQWFWPMATLVAWTAIVWFTMYRRRIAEMRRKRIHPQQLAARRAVLELLEDAAAANNFNNLMEVPTLFHLAMLAAIVLGIHSPLMWVFAWTFVALRMAHSLVHISYNKVMHRFALYAFSTLLVWGIWLELALKVAG